ncbi:hypothetical protein ASE17_05825 [Phenylobacterium sp. Root77]|uniref:DUF3325 family protein n=1 Tax=unclassified Phenylobacterium TaxID=2640670 RepID=UPI000700D4E9|nr:MULTISPECIES: DUF3325 family protein [unclassified Phenylobacterium]KQW66433.1 hypothetical protein ASC73_18800 [Phenylobacterium sp. Root1277]KQW88939.1 hypothetical protein ASC79_19705 [Phenylobacterium sp. Root1290]KRC42206.1 hypothetical protein ASE17_05825 [Phenylobacterium sp. Root77]
MELLGFVSAPLAFAAFISAALSMDRHHRQVTGHACPAERRARLRLSSKALFVLAILVGVIGGGVGLVAGILGAGLAAGAVVTTLTVRPALLARLLAPRAS